MESEYSEYCPPPAAPPPPTIRDVSRSGWSSATPGARHTSRPPNNDYDIDVVRQELQVSPSKGRPGKPSYVGAEYQDATRDYHPPPKAPDMSKFTLPDKVYSCVCKLVVYKDPLKAGVVELQGSNGEKAYCFFLSRNVVVKSISKLSDQLRVGRFFKVNARLINEENPIPYLASTVIPGGVDEKLLDDFRDPMPQDVEEYGRLAHILHSSLHQNESNDVLEEASEPVTVFDKRQKSRLPAPRPAPRNPPVSLPLPTVAYPIKARLPTPVPLPAASIYHQPGSSVMQPFSIAGQVVAPNISGGVSREFMEEKTSYLDLPKHGEQARLAKEYKEQQDKKLLEAQKKAQRIMMGEAADDSDDEVEELTVLDKVINNLEVMIQKEQKKNTPKPSPIPTMINRKTTNIPTTIVSARMSVPPPTIRGGVVAPNVRPSVPVLVDKYGYVVRDPFAEAMRAKVVSTANPNPMDYYKSMFPDPIQRKLELELEKVRNNKERAVTRRKNPTEYTPSFRALSSERERQRTRTRSRSKDRRSRSKDRRSRSKDRRSKSKDRRSKSKSRSRNRVRNRSRSAGRQARRRSRSRSSVQQLPGPRANRTRSRSRRRRTRSKTRSKSGERRSRRSSRSKSRSRERRSRRSSRERSRSRGREKEKEKEKDKERDQRKRKDAPYSGPPVPAFMMHPADRLLAGDTDSRRVRKRKDHRRDRSSDETDGSKGALEETLKLIVGMAADADEEPPEKEIIFVTMEVEMLNDGQFNQITQIGAGSEDKVTGVFNKSFFRPILPTYMAEYDNNLILKNQQNLHSSLKFKFNETDSSYTFNHVKKGEEPLLTEKKAFEEFISHLKKVKMDKQVVIFTHSKEILAPLLMARLEDLGLVESFSSAIRGFCDFTSCISNLKLGGIYKEAKFSDLVDVYRHILGKQWPRETRHADGVAVLSGTLLKKLINDYSDYLEDQKELTLSMKKFLDVCGLQSVAQIQVGFKEIIFKHKMESVARRNEVQELELRPSDRPGEITIVTLKRFECFEVLDMDEVEEEGINEDDYFEAEGLVASVMEKTVIKSGFVIPVKMRLKMPSLTIVDTNDIEKLTEFLNSKYQGWSLVAKNIEFGGGLDIVIKQEGDKGTEQKRVQQTRKCGIARQIVAVKRNLKPTEDDESKCEEEMVVIAKVLNPTDIDMVLNAGDEIANCKLEKGPDPEKPERKTYSQIKEEAEQAVLKAELEHEEREIQRKLDEEKKAKRKAKRKKNKLNKSKESNDPTNETMDMEALDFEPVASDESFDEENVSSDEDELLNKESGEASISLSEEEGEVLSPVNVVASNNKVTNDTSNGLFNNSKKDTERREERRSYRSRKDDDKRDDDKRDDDRSSRSRKDDERRDDDRSSRSRKEDERSSRSRRDDDRKSRSRKDDRREDRSKSRSRRDDRSSRSERSRREDDRSSRSRRSRSRSRREKEGKSNDHRRGDETTKRPVVSENDEIEIVGKKNGDLDTSKITKCFENNGNTSKITKLMDENDIQKLFFYLEAQDSITELPLGGGVKMVLAVKMHPGVKASQLIGRSVWVEHYDSRFYHKNNEWSKEQSRALSSAFQSSAGMNVIHAHPKNPEIAAVTVFVRNITARTVHIAKGTGLAYCKVLANDWDWTGSTSAPKEFATESPTVTQVNELQQPPSGVASNCFGPMTLELFHMIESMINENKFAYVKTILEVCSIKKLKKLLQEAGQHTYGLKADLVKRLHDYLMKNPDFQHFDSQTVVSKFLEELLCTVTGCEPPPEGETIPVFGDMESKTAPVNLPPPVPQQGPELVTRFGNCSVIQMGNDGSYYKDGVRIPVLGSGGSSLPAPVPASAPVVSQETSTTAPVENTEIVLESDEKKEIDVDKLEEEKEVRILKKMAQIKAYEKMDFEFFTNGTSIKVTEDVTVRPKEKKILTFSMSEMDTFASELVGRKLLVKERANSKKTLTVFKQIVECTVKDRRAEIEVLVRNDRDYRSVDIKKLAGLKLIRVYVEKRITDLDYQFDVPEDDDHIELMEEYIEKKTVDALTTNDIMLKPKAYHTEICVAKVDWNFEYDPVVHVERTKASTMKIGMRKMVLVPKVLTFSKIQDGEATVSVRIYNASKVNLKITAKTPIVSLRVQKPGVISKENLMEVKPDARRRFGEVVVTDRKLRLKDQQLMMLTYTKRGTGERKPCITRVIMKKGVMMVNLGQEQGVVKEDFKVQLLNRPPKPKIET